MHYCGMDVSRKSTHVYIEDAQGRRVTRGIVATTPTGLAQAVERYAARGVRVAIEAGNQTAWIVDLLRELGAKVHVVHPLKVKLIAESKKKTDRIDAQLLAHLLRIGGLPEPVHVPSHRSRELRGLLVARRQLVHMRTRLVNWWPTRGWRRVCGRAGSGWNTDGSRNRGGARFARSGSRPRTRPSPSRGRRPPRSSAGGHGSPVDEARRRRSSP
jgi:transposase